MMDGQNQWACLARQTPSALPRPTRMGVPVAQTTAATAVDERLLAATKTCDDAGAVYLDVQPVGVEVGCVGAPWLDLLSLASPGCPAGPLGQLRRVGLPDNSLGLACCTGLPLRSRLGEPFGRDQGESGQQAPK